MRIAELLVTANLDSEQTRRIAANIRRASEQMKNLLTATVSVAKGRVEEIQSCKLSEILSAASDAAGVARLDDIKMIIDAPRDIELWMDRQRIEDTGPGIPAEIRCRLFAAGK